MSKKQMLFSKDQPGFTLVEVLVALAVVAIGLLGLASLQTIGLRNNHSVNLTAQALWLATDITDRIRSNGRDNYDNRPLQDICSAPPDGAARDLCAWDQTVRQMLGPTATTLVCIDSNPLDNQNCVNANAENPAGMPYMVRIIWDDPVQENGRQQLTTCFIR